MEQVPPEILEFILSFLPFGPDWFAVKVTCKKWLEASKKSFDHSIDKNRALRFGCRRGFPRLVSFLLSDNRIVPFHCSDWWTDNSMVLSCMYGQVEVVKVLLKDVRLTRLDIA